MISWFRFRCFTAIALALTVLSPVLAFAADNTATGNIAGVDADLNDSNTITLTSTTLSLVKAAFLADGTPLASGSPVPRGTIVKFLVYLDNSTAFPVDTVNVADALVAAFQYQAGSIKVDASQNTGSAIASVYAAVNTAAALTDAVSNADIAGINGSTVSAGSGTGNAVVTAPAGKVWALLFTVQMQ